jgi:hypothetical protein
MIQRAYDQEMLSRPADREAPGCCGWTFGLPPGIASQQWPVDPHTGYPLMHGFTLLLPEDYRCHGTDIVALSFFATAPDHNDGGNIDEPAMARAVLDGDAPATAKNWRRRPWPNSPTAGLSGAGLVRTTPTQASRRGRIGSRISRNPATRAIIFMRTVRSPLTATGCTNGQRTTPPITSAERCGRCKTSPLLPLLRRVWRRVRRLQFRDRRRPA